MKKYVFLLIILLAVGCEKSDQFTSVEGYVTDYYSKEPIAEIPLKITESKYFCYPSCDVYDTVFSNSDGYYYYDFFNTEDRTYKIEILQTETYYSSFQERIAIGKTNTLNFDIKPFKNLTLNFHNESNTFNWLSVYSYINDSEFKCNPCEGLEVFDYKIVPEIRNDFYIGLVHYDEENKADSSKGEYLRFVAGINDTTINYYY
ncbi:MAG: hypothetical protein JXA77_01250 [Bacteroidales bacterium]|nr:hypothetical protein [Bacteroidales bacterium]